MNLGQSCYNNLYKKHYNIEIKKQNLNEKLNQKNK